MFDPTSTVSTTQEIAPLSRRHGVSAGHATHPGRIRAANEDHLACAPDLGFFVVADGVGGSPGGAVAARLATASMVTALRYAARTEVVPDADTVVADEEAITESARLIAAANQAHRMIYEHGQRSGCPGAATTMVALWMLGDRALVANTGDSRAYRLDNGTLELLSHDHSALQEYVDAFGSTSVRAVLMLENIVTRVLGGHSPEPHEVRLRRTAVEGPEVFLLCTDGLWKAVSEPVIAEVLSAARTAQDAADKLIALANEAGGPDNITCIVVRVARG